MRHAWRAWILFGAGALFGLLAGAVLYAPPELANQPPPWQRAARDHGQAVAASRPAPAPVSTAAASVPAASATPAPVAAAPASVPPVQSPLAGQAPVAPAPEALADAPLATPPQAVAKEVTASRAPAPKKRKTVPNDPVPVDTMTSGAGPAAFAAGAAPETLRVEPESFRAPASEPAPARGDVEATDSAR